MNNLNIHVEESSSLYHIEKYGVEREVFHSLLSALKKADKEEGMENSSGFSLVSIFLMQREEGLEREFFCCTEEL